MRLPYCGFKVTQSSSSSSSYYYYYYYYPKPFVFLSLGGPGSSGLEGLFLEFGPYELHTNNDVSTTPMTPTAGDGDDAPPLTHTITTPTTNYDYYRVP